MEGKCQCQWSNSVPLSCTCSRQTPCPPRLITEREGNYLSSNKSAAYWAHTLANEDGNSKRIVFGGNRAQKISKVIANQPFKEMTNWNYPASVCMAPCTFTRRLNRSYSEQRMRCLLTTTIAFCLGISVGALLPFVFPPVDMIHSTLSSSPQSVLSARANYHVSLASKRAPVALPKDNSRSESSGSASYSESVINDTAPNLVYSSVTFVDKPVTNFSESESFQKEANYLPVADGVYWSEWAESLVPAGFSDSDVSNWQSLADSAKVTKVESGCGRMQNRLVTYENGNKACCRYRQNFDQIQGEIFSFYLSQLLGIKNLAPSTLDVISSKSAKWSGVQEEIQSAQWVDDRPVVLTKFVNNLNPAFIPSLLRPSSRRVHPPDLPSPNRANFDEASSPTNSTVGVTRDSKIEEIRELVQWSDLIIFDYLTANLDRMVNNLYNLQWNPTMMEAPAHNLAKDSNGLLIFLDNESGLLHGYRLLDKYEHYHRLMLDSFCVFRKSTVEAIERLHSYGSIQPLFKTMLSQFSSSHLLPMIPDKSIKILTQRIDTVYRQIQKCQSLYVNRTTNNA